MYPVFRMELSLRAQCCGGVAIAGASDGDDSANGGDDAAVVQGDLTAFFTDLVKYGFLPQNTASVLTEAVRVSQYQERAFVLYHTYLSSEIDVSQLRDGLNALAEEYSTTPTPSPLQAKLQRYVDVVYRSGFLTPAEYTLACKLVATSNRKLLQLYATAQEEADLTMLNKGLMALTRGALASGRPAPAESSSSSSGGNDGDDDGDDDDDDDDDEEQRAPTARPLNPTPGAGELNHIVDDMFEEGEISRGKATVAVERCTDCGGL